MTRVPQPSPAAVAAQAAQLAALRDLLEAIRDTVAPPRPERWEDREAFDQFQRDRAIVVSLAAKHALLHRDLIESIAADLRASAVPPYEPRKDVTP